MGVLGNLGVNLPKVNPVNWGSAGLIILLVIVFVVVGIVTFMIVLNKINNKKYINKINFTKEVNGQIYLVGEDFAKVLTIPYTTIKVFYLKKGKTYSPKLIFDSGRNNYIIHIGKGGEWINTILRWGKDGVVELNDTLKPTRDYANENLKELIKRNWMDKNKDWWKENAHYIFLIILGVIIVTFLIWGGILLKKTAVTFNSASGNYLKASEIYSQTGTDFVNFCKENIKQSSGVLPVGGG